MEGFMTCSKCLSKDVVKHIFQTFEYYYCRKCQDECQLFSHYYSSPKTRAETEAEFMKVMHKRIDEAFAKSVYRLPESEYEITVPKGYVIKNLDSEESTDEELKARTQKVLDTPKEGIYEVYTPAPDKSEVDPTVPIKWPFEDEKDEKKAVKPLPLDEIYEIQENQNEQEPQESEEDLEKQYGLFDYFYKD